MWRISTLKPRLMHVCRLLMTRIWIHHETHVCQNKIWRYVVYRENRLGSGQTGFLSGMTYRILYQQNFRTNRLLSPKFTVLLYRCNVGASKTQNASKVLAKSPMIHAVAALLSWIKELTKHDNHNGHKFHNWCGRSRQERKPLRVEIRGTEQILFWQPSDVESTVERNPSSGLSLIAESWKNYAYCDWTNCSETIWIESGANDRSANGSTIIMKVFESPRGVSRIKSQWRRCEVDTLKGFFTRS